jgi:hypothetical protein
LVETNQNLKSPIEEFHHVVECTVLVSAPGKHRSTLINIERVVGEEVEVEEGLDLPLLGILYLHSGLTADGGGQNHQYSEQYLPRKPAVLAVLLERTQHNLIDQLLLLSIVLRFPVRLERLLLNF